MQQAQVQQPNSEQQTQVPISKKTKRPINLRWLINSPYLLALLPLLVGGFYLVLHPEVITIGVNNPYAVAFVLAIPVAVFIIKLVLNFFSVIEQWVRLQFEKAKQAKRGHFFEIVTAVFMFVSVCEAGPFFNDIQHNVLGGALGYITVLAFDLIAVVCIDARRKELAKGGSKAGVYLTGVIICALVSMVANLYSALLNFQAPSAQNFPEFLKSIAPYVGIMFPIMIVFLAFSRDAEIEIDDAETYKKQQQKRVDFLKARREILAGVLAEMEQIALLGKREFFLKSLLFTKNKLAYVVETVTAKVVELVNAEINALKDEITRKEQVISAQAKEITLQVQAVQALSREAKELSAALASQRQLFDERYQHMGDQIEHITRFRDELLTANQQDFGSFEQQLDAKIRTLQSDFQRQLEQIKAITAAHLMQQKKETKPDLEVPNTPQNTPLSETKEGDLAGSPTPENYGLNEAEIQALLLAFPGVKEWFAEMPSSVSESEVMEVANIRLNSLKNAIDTKAIKPARGRGNKLQTETVLRWLLSRVKRSANRARNTISNTTPNGQEMPGEIPGNVPSNPSMEERDTGDIPVVKPETNGNGNGHTHEDNPLDYPEYQPSM